MNHERLLKLADFLEAKVQPERFDMSVWAAGKLADCGTAGCALGWATVCFDGEGLTMREALFGLVPQCDGEEDFDAGAAFFGLTLDESFDLFDSDSYAGDPNDITPATVASRIREMVATDLAEATP